MRSTTTRRVVPAVAAAIAAGLGLATLAVPYGTAQATTTTAATAAAAAAAVERAELVTNGGSESGGTAGWTGTGGSTLTLGYSTRRSGATSIKVNGRTTHTAGAAQPLTSMVAGSSYEVSAWVHYRDLGDASTTFQVVLTDAAGTRLVMAQGPVAKGTATATLEFVQVKGTFTAPTTGFDLKTAQLSIQTSGGTVPDIYFLDDVSVFGDREIPPPPPDQLERNDNTEPGSFGAFAKIPGTDAASRRGNPLVTQNFGADPWAMEVDGRVYVYTTNDTQEWPRHLATGASNSYGAINQINVWSSADMLNWTNHGAIDAAGPEGIAGPPTGTAGRPSNSWAPAAASRDTDGDGDEEFFLYFANSAGGIWVLEGDSPTGPFTSPRTNALVGFDTPGVRGNSDPDATDVVWLFDPAVLVDDDGQAYLYFGGGVPTTGGGADDPDTARVIKLNDDMTSVEGEAKLVNAPGIFEDSGIHKVGDTYYYTYCTNFSHNVPGLGRGDIVVMESKDPMGPWSAPRLVFPNQQRFFGQGTGGNNHHAFFTFDDQWYLTYHAPTLDAAIQGPANAAGFRNAHIEPVTLDADGSVKEVAGTYAGPGQKGTLDPYAGPVSAETIAWQAGTRQGFDGPATFEGQTPRTELTSIDDRDWTSLGGVAFGQGAGSISARVQPEAGGTITVRTSGDQGSDANVVARMTVPAGDGTTWTTLTAPLAPGALAGTRDVYFTYSGAGTDELFDVESWTFTRGAPPVTTPAPPAVVQQPTSLDLRASDRRVRPGRKVGLSITVNGTPAPTGQVQLRAQGKLLKTVAYAGTTVRTKVRLRGVRKHVVRAIYLGSPTAAPSSDRVRVVVRPDAR